MFKIKVAKVIVRGLKKIKILELEALKEGDLPIAYCADPRAMWLAGSSGCYRTLTGMHVEQLRVGEEYHRLKFMAVLEKIYKAGDLLKRINAELALENEGWSGEVEYHI